MNAVSVQKPLLVSHISLSMRELIQVRNSMDAGNVEEPSL